MCGKKHAQESGYNNNNDNKSSKLIRFKKCVWDKIESTHGYAWYGHACTAPCTYNVVCMCGKIHAQQSDKNNNNRSNKTTRLGRYEWGRNVCQEAIREAVDKATCKCVIA